MLWLERMLGKFPVWLLLKLLKLLAPPKLLNPPAKPAPAAAPVPSLDCCCCRFWGGLARLPGRMLLGANIPPPPPPLLKSGALGLRPFGPGSPVAGMAICG